jgi:spore coat polysaccharide biosynthesis predicted glycosyltransferase SpsG
VLAGPRYALLRQEFADARRDMGTRQISGTATRLLVSMGGTDAANVTGRVLAALQAATLAPDTAVTVLLGRTSPWVEPVRAAAARLPWPVDVRVDAAGIARILLHADLAIGAAGSSSWERCAVGVPSIAVIVADNQRAPARTLRARDAAIVIGADEIDTRLSADVTRLAADADARARLSQSSAALVDAQGVDRIVRIMAEAQVAA